MSINGMNTLALDRATALEEGRPAPHQRRPQRRAARRAAAPPRRPEEGAPAPEEAAVADEQPAAPTTKGFEELTRYIPTEAVTFYLAVLGIVGATSGDFTGRWIAFLVFIVITPAMVWIDWRIKERATPGPTSKAAKQLLAFNAVAALLAFVAWAFALPATPFTDFSWYDAAWAGFAALVVPYLLTKGEGLFLPLERQPAPAGGPA